MKNIAGPCYLLFSFHGSALSVIKQEKSHSVLANKQDKIRRELKEIGVRILEKEEVESMTGSVCQYLGSEVYSFCTSRKRDNSQLMLKY